MSLLLQKQQWILLFQRMSDDLSANEAKLQRLGLRTVEFTDTEYEAWLTAYRSIRSDPVPLSSEQKVGLVQAHLPRYVERSNADPEYHLSSLTTAALLECDFETTLRIFAADTDRVVTPDAVECSIRRSITGVSRIDSLARTDLKSDSLIKDTLLATMICRTFRSRGHELTISEELLRSIVSRPDLIYLLGICGFDMIAPLDSKRGGDGAEEERSSLRTLGYERLKRATLLGSVLSEIEELRESDISDLQWSAISTALQFASKSKLQLYLSSRLRLNPNSLRYIERLLTGLEIGEDRVAIDRTILSPSFDPELREYSLTKGLLSLLISQCGGDKRKEYEARNILERWIISMANLLDEQGYTVPQPLWTSCYCLSSIGEDHNRKLISEIVEKRILTHPQAVKIVDSILRRIERALLDGASSSGASSELRVKMFDNASGGGAIMVDGETIALTPRMRALLNRVNTASGTDSSATEALGKMIVQYRAALEGSQHWGLPQEHADRLYEIGFRNEGFASPLNSRFAGKPEGRFCSLFPRTDAPFGSMGSLFRTDLLSHPGDWTINPPFVESIMNRTAHLLLEQLTRAREMGRPILVLLLLPAWRDADFYKILTSSDFTIRETPLNRGRYRFELPNSEQIVASVDCLYLTLSSGVASDPEKMSALESALDGLNSSSPLL